MEKINFPNEENDSQNYMKPDQTKQLITEMSKQIESLKKDNQRLINLHKEKVLDQIQENLLIPDKTFGLNVSDDVMPTKMEVEIINTPSFQRLGYIKQLGSTYLVYRSANHTRFEHSLGVLKMADLMITKIRNNRHSSIEERSITLEEEQIIRLLALLHDIGHMPFGHTIEDEFGIFQSHDRHEARWQYFLGEKSEIGQIIIKYKSVQSDGSFDEEKGKAFHKRFFELIKCEKDFTGKESDAYMYDIVSNTVCADLLDYLLRDCQYTNLKIKFHPRFLDYLVIKKIKNKETSKEERHIVIRLCKRGSKEPRKDIMSELVQLLRYRYYLGERVYYHHTKIKTGTLIAGAVLRAKESNCFEFVEGFEPGKYTYQNGDSYLYEIHKWSDERLLNKLEDLPDKKGANNSLVLGAKSLTKSYKNRVIYKQLHKEDRKSLGLNPEKIDEVLSGQISLNDNHILEVRLLNEFGNSLTRLKYEEEICDLLPDMQSGDFLIYFPSYKMQMKLAKVLVEDEDGIARELRVCTDKIIEQECAEIIEKHQNLWQIRVLINPQFTKAQSNPDKTEEYKEYVNILEKYCKFIFARNDEDKKEFGREFWKALLEFKIDYELDGKAESVELYNPIKNTNIGKKNRNTLINSLAEEFAGHTSSKRTNSEVIQKLVHLFTQNHKK